MTYGLVQTLEMYTFGVLSMIPFYDYAIILFFLFIQTGNRALFAYDFCLKHLLRKYKEPIKQFIEKNTKSISQMEKMVSTN